jgi:hypothetical protein
MSAENFEPFWERPDWMMPTRAMLNLLQKDNMSSGSDKIRDDDTRARVAAPAAPSPEQVLQEQLNRLSAADRDIYKNLATDEQKRVYLERQQVYGSCTHSHQCIGQAWAAYLSNFYGRELPPLPAYAVAHLLTLFKVLRATRVYHSDNYIDGHNYFEFANSFQRNGQ